MEAPTLSLVLPIFNEEEIIPELDRRLRAFLADVGSGVGESWEVIFVNDGSKDKSLPMLRALAASEPRYKLLSFSRNFGHQRAITAGLDRANGAAVVVMDADLQDPPEVVREMVARWREGYDVVYGVRSRRHGETMFKKFTAAAYYRLRRMMLGGVSIAVDGSSSFSTGPLRIAFWLGVAAGLVALAGGVWAVYEKLFGTGVVQGWTTIMILVGLGSSAQLLMTGILGEYVGRIYEEVKRRPLYVVEDEVSMGQAVAPPPAPRIPGGGALR